MSEREERWAELAHARQLLKYVVTAKEDADLFRAKAKQFGSGKISESYKCMAKDNEAYARKIRLEVKAILQEVEKSAGADYVKGEDHRPSARHLNYQG